MHKNRDVRNLLGVLGAAIVCAALLAYAFIHYYGPSGRYLAGHVLLDPAIFKQINYREKDPATGQTVNLQFDRIEFSKAPNAIKKEIPVEAYQRFYTLVATDKSVPGHERAFSEPSSLKIWMKGMGESAKIFQVVQFIREDEYRVRLQDGEWAYFSHPNIYQEVQKL